MATSQWLEVLKVILSENELKAAVQTDKMIAAGENGVLFTFVSNHVEFLVNGAAKKSAFPQFNSLVGVDDDFQTWPQLIHWNKSLA